MKIVNFLKKRTRIEVGTLPVIVASLLLIGTTGMTLVFLSSSGANKPNEGTTDSNVSQGKTLDANIRAKASNPSTHLISTGETSAVETSTSSVLGDTTPASSTTPLPEPTPPPYDDPVLVDPPLTCKYPKEGTPPLCYWQPCDPCRDSNILCPLNSNSVRYPCAVCSSNPEPLFYCPQLDRAELSISY